MSTCPAACAAHAPARESHARGGLPRHCAPWRSACQRMRPCRPSRPCRRTRTVDNACSNAMLEFTSPERAVRRMRLRGPKSPLRSRACVCTFAHHLMRWLACFKTQERGRGRPVVEGRVRKTLTWHCCVARRHLLEVREGDQTVCSKGARALRILIREFSAKYAARSIRPSEDVQR